MKNIEVPFKYLLIDPGSRNWVVSKADESPRAAFKGYHGFAPSIKAVLWAIPVDVTVTDSLSYMIPHGKPNWPWVKIGRVREVEQNLEIKAKEAASV